MPRLFVYRIKTDSGAAPHISDGYLTLTICKPEIRKEAKNGEYVLALVARTSNAMKTLKKEKKVAKNDMPFLAAYLFRVGDVIPMEQYDKWCTDHAPHKLCTEEHFEGNAQYNKNLKWRPGPHPESFRELDIGGCNSLTSSHFAAWTSTSPHRLTVEEIEGLGLTEEDIVKRGIGHKIVEMPNTVMAERLIASKAAPANNKGSRVKYVPKNKTAKNNGPRGNGSGAGPRGNGSGAGPRGNGSGAGSRGNGSGAGSRGCGSGAK
jgi:hypothetical protein